MSMNKLIKAARVAGYAHGLDGNFLYSTSQVARIGGDLYTTNREALEGAFQSGLSDGYAVWIKAHGLTITEAAKAKGVALNTLHRLLRDDKRRENYFMSAYSEGEGSRRQWWLHPRDVEMWTPAPTKPSTPRTSPE